MYRGVFVDGKITNPKTGRTLDLKVYSDDENQSMPYLQGVSIKTGHNVDMSMSITLAPPYEKALEYMSQDQEWFRLGNTLALRWGYSDVDGAISDWHMGLMMLPEPDFGEEITITIPAVGYGFTANRISRLRSWSVPGGERTFLSVAEEIAKHYGMVVEFNVENENAKTLLTTERIDLTQCGRTDLQFLTFQALDAGAQLIVRNNKFIFTDRGAPSSGEEEVAAVFQMYGKMDVWNNRFPLTSFSPESMGTLFLQDHQGMAYFASDPNADPEGDVEGVTETGADSDNNAYSAKTTVDAPTEEGAAPGIKNSDGSVNTAKSTVVADIEQMAAGRYIPIPMGEDFAREKSDSFLKGARDSDASDQGIRVNFSSPVALPFLIPGMFIRLLGVGDYFSAVYFLQEQEVTISDGGAEMTGLAGTKGFPGINPDVDTFSSSVKKHEEPVDGDPMVVAIAPNPYEGE